MKKILLLIPLCVLSVSLRSQSLSPVVLASSGGFYTFASGTLSATVGEMTMVETFSSGSNKLTQGFHQPNDILSVGIEQPHATVNTNVSFNVYPNPASDQVTVASQFDKPGKILLQLFDHLGQLVSSVPQENAVNGQFQSNLHIEDFAPGIYSLRLTYNSSSNNKQVYVQKISIIR